MSDSHKIQEQHACYSCKGSGVCQACAGKGVVSVDKWVWVNPDAPDKPDTHWHCHNGYSGKVNCARCKAMPVGEDPEKFYIDKCPIWRTLESD